MFLKNIWVVHDLGEVSNMVLGYYRCLLGCCYVVNKVINTLVFSCLLAKVKRTLLLKSAWTRSCCRLLVWWCISNWNGILNRGILIEEYWTVSKLRVEGVWFRLLHKSIGLLSVLLSTRWKLACQIAKKSNSTVSRRISAKIRNQGCPRLRIFIVESEFSNLADIRLIVESYVWGRGKIHYQKTVIITDVNTQRKCVMDTWQIQKWCFMFWLKDS